MRKKDLHEWFVPYKDSVFGDGVAILEKRFTCVKGAIFSMEDVKDHYLNDIYDTMVATLNCGHDQKFNVYVVLLKQKYGRVDLVIVHDHMEDIGLIGVTGLSRLFAELDQIGSPILELYDNFWEKLMIKVSSAPFKFTEKASEVKCTEFDYGDDEK